MSDNTPPPSGKDQAVKLARQAKDTVDSLSTTAETVGTAFSAIKWTAIAVSLGFVFALGWLGYKIVSAPAKAAANATESVTEAVKSGAENVSKSTSNIIHRLTIPSSNQGRTNTLSETAFSRLNNMAATPPDSLKARTFWAANLKGHDNRVCQLTIDFGGGEIPVLLAADNKAYAKSKSLGSKNNRLIRIMIRTEGDDLPLRVEWDESAAAWIMKWRATTTKKPLEDSVAAARLSDILTAAKAC